MSDIWLEMDDGFAIMRFAENASMNPERLTLWGQLVEQVEQDEAVKGLILTSTGKMFHQGFDLEFMGGASPDDILALVNGAMDVMGRILQFPVPTACAVNGHAFGLGAMMVLSVDYAAMREDRGFFCLPEIDLGMPLIPSMNALVTQRLSPTNVRDVLFAGQRIAGPDAVARGIVDEAAPEAELIERCKALMAPMLGKQGPALSRLKKDAASPILAEIERKAVSIS